MAGCQRGLAARDESLPPGEAGDAGDAIDTASDDGDDGAAADGGGGGGGGADMSTPSGCGKGDGWVDQPMRA